MSSYSHGLEIGDVLGLGLAVVVVLVLGVKAELERRR